MKNLIASIQFKLKQLANQESKSYQLILTRYFQERLLYRIFVSDYKAHFCLKGGALLYAFERETSRPTMDIDLLGLKISNNLAQFKQIFYEICQIRDESDAIDFHLETITVAEIKKEDKYSGVRVKVVVQLGNIKQNLQIDIGFGDIITPHPILMDYPTLLEMGVPKIQAYSMETVIAEKFEAMIDLAEMNSRMKDFYDLYRLLNQRKYDSVILTQAILNTFQRRKTIYLIERKTPIPLGSGMKANALCWESSLKKGRVAFSV